MNKMRYYYLMDGLDENLPICQYMDLDYLLRLLGTRSYYVKAKELFPDKRESSLPLKSIFRLQPVEPGSYKGSDSISSKDSLKKYREYKESGAFLTACWTEREGESALMWANFTTKMGICIKSTIHNFIASFENDDYEIYCGRMSYNGYNAEQDSHGPCPSGLSLPFFPNTFLRCLKLTSLENIFSGLSSGLYVLSC